MESFHVESSSFIQNLKAFNISNARQLVSVYCRHVESLGSFQYFQCQATSVNVVITNTKKEKVRNQTTYITKFRREGDRLKRRRKKKKEEEEEEAVASWRHPCFVIVFFLFSFFSDFFPYKCDFSCFGSVSIYRPKQLDFASTAGTTSIFSGMKQGGYLYRYDRYSIYRPYQPVWYEIDFLDIYTLIHIYVHIFKV